MFEPKRFVLDLSVTCQFESPLTGRYLIVYFSDIIDGKQKTKNSQKLDLVIAATGSEIGVQR